MESASPCSTAPFGAAVLYLRGSMNNWAAQDDSAFQYSCDAYYLNVRMSGSHEFKIADAAWAAGLTFGAAGGSSPAPVANESLALARGTEPQGTANVRFAFAGEHTVRLAFPGGRPVLTIGPKSFADPTVVAVTDPVALSLRHDSRSIAHKTPFGAVTAPGTVRFALDALPGIDEAQLVISKREMRGNQEVLAYTEVARLPMVLQRSDAKAAIAAPGVTAIPPAGNLTNDPASQPTADAPRRWSASYQFADIGVYGYHFEVRIGNQRYVVHNNADTIPWTRERGSNGLGEVVAQPASPTAVRRFRLTVYASDFVVPAWAADAVYYYIFPERYRNGDPANDPRPGRATYQNHPVEHHDNWLERPYKPGTGDGSDGVYNNDFFGGDLQGIIDKLGDIADLGANTIYMTPIFQAASNHKYDTADYTRVDPGFGTNQDFTRLTAEAAKRGIRVILDTSLNHVGTDSIYFDRFGKYGGQGAFAGGRINPASPYADWFRFDPSQAAPERQYSGWVGVTDLPEVNKSSASFRRFAYGAPDSVMKQWLDRGASGWRMDVAPWVPDDFWREWRSAIKAHKPDAITVAEAWFESSKYFLGDMFDSTMNYVFRNALLDYANGGPATALAAPLELLRELYPPQTFHALMNLVSSHDQARALHLFGWTSPTSSAATITLAKQRLRLATFFQMTYPGSPAVYYGDEVGVTGGDDPFNRAPYPWADLGGQPDLALRAEFKTLIGLRQAHPVLRRGSLRAPLLADDHVLVLVRQLGDTWAITATNNAAQASSVTVALPDDFSATTLTDALTGAQHRVEGRSIAITVPPLFGTVWVGR